MNFTKSHELRAKAHRLIPGGTHTYAKGDDQYPVESPGFIQRGEGCFVWDVDGNKFIEYGMGLRAVTLGHAYPPVIEASIKQMQLGENFTRPAEIECRCAEAVLDLIEGAEMIKFAKNGSDATTAAVKLARAATGRDLVAICAEHPMLSSDDWFIGSTPMAAGIPRQLRNLTVKFHYNDIESVKALFVQYPGQIACIIMEAATWMEPKDSFLNNVQDLCRKNGALFVLDELITGFRWHLQGAQKVYGLTPDLCTFGKAIANGFSVSALLGKRELMELGGLYHNKERVFLLSLTHGAEGHCMAACLETLATYRRCNVVDYLYQQGERLIKGVNASIKANDVEGHFELLGRPCNLVFATRDQEKMPSQPFRTLFLQEMIRRGFITPSLVVSYSHTDQVIDQTIDAINETLVIYRKALDEGIDKYLESRPVKPVLRQYC